MSEEPSYYFNEMGRHVIVKALRSMLDQESLTKFEIQSAQAAIQALDRA